MARIFGILTCVFCVVGLVGTTVYGQPIDGSDLTFIEETPTYEGIGLTPIHADIPIILGQTGNDDREPKMCILENGTTAVFWVNRGGSHHVNGVDASGNRVFDVFTDGSAPDVIIGVPTGGNTNWTLCDSLRGSNTFMAGATWKFGNLFGGNAVVPDTVVDADGIHEDEGQGHGFFMLFGGDLQPTSGPISVGQFSAGHREWDAVWLNNGKLVIASVARDHKYAADPDYPDGGTRVGVINIFNADGTRAVDEFFVDDMTGYQGDLRCGALPNGFVVVYQDHDAETVTRAAIFDNDGNPVKSVVVQDQLIGSGFSFMDGAGGDNWITIHEPAVPDGTAGLPAEMAGTKILLAQMWNAQGDPIGPPIMVTQHLEARDWGRPRIAMAPNGSFAISWDDKWADSVTFAETMVVRVFNADGTPATDAFIPHKLPEFPDKTAGNAGEPIPGISDDLVGFSWASRGLTNGGDRDIVVSVFPNPAQGGGPANVSEWELY